MTVVPQYLAHDFADPEPSWERRGQLARGGLALAVSVAIHAILAALLAIVLAKAPKDPGSRDQSIAIEVSLTSPPPPPAPPSAPAPSPEQPLPPVEPSAVPPAAQASVPAPAAKPKPQPPSRAAKPKQAPGPALHEFKDEFEDLARDFSEGGTPTTPSHPSVNRATVPMMGSRKAAILSSTRIPYPRGAREQGIDGTVVVQIQVGPDGSFAGAQVVQSSGFPELDAAALEGVRTWHYRPEVRSGIATGGSILHTVIFTGEKAK
jgi:protein TonB